MRLLESILGVALALLVGVLVGYLLVLAIIFSLAVWG